MKIELTVEWVLKNLTVGFSSGLDQTLIGCETSNIPFIELALETAGIEFEFIQWYCEDENGEDDYNNPINDFKVNFDDIKRYLSDDEIEMHLGNVEMRANQINDIMNIVMKDYMKGNLSELSDIIIDFQGENALYFAKDYTKSDIADFELYADMF